MKSKSLLTILIIITFILLSEVVIRSLEKNPSSSDLYSLTDDEILAYTLTPNYTKTISKFDETEQKIKTRFIEKVNSIGLSDYERPIKKDNSTYRIIALGDSVIRGYGSDFNENLVLKLENILNNKNNSNEKYEVLNFGIDGYSSVQEVQLLKTKGLNYKPDMLIVGYVINDPKVEAPFSGLVDYDKKIKRESKVIKLSGLPNICSVKNYLRKSRVISQIMNQWQNLGYLLNNHTRSYNQFSSYYNNFCNWGKVEYSFSEISKLSKENNFKVLLVIFPYMYIGDVHDLGEFYKKVEKEGEKNSFEILNLVEPLEQEGFINIKTDSYHFKGSANTIIAQKIYEKIKVMNIT